MSKELSTKGKSEQDARGWQNGARQVKTAETLYSKPIEKGYFPKYIL